MDIDWTVLAFEVVNFGILVVLLQRFLYRPVQRTIEVRRAEIEKLHDELVEREQAATHKAYEYEHRLQELDDRAQERLESALAEGRERAEALVAEGREQARNAVTAAEQQVESTRRRALEQLRLEVLRLAAAAATRVVQHMGAPAVDRAYARRAAHGLAEAKNGELVGPIRVAVGEDTDPDAVEAELRAVLGPTMELVLTVEPGIVAGARLQAEGYEVEASASASLRRWYEEQLGENASGPEAIR
ncbi:ATP synthase F0 subunit B [Paraliomyxa miuraensis]|uniref:ATP synthase F0 subunit B n=1 Tax=Paraliomyxa miuraensis TaxID=376150 RepID=UPI00225B3BB5|nr:ATP synthase F0 subunit B [Paraliomyxa miuraensis]MCX4244901.1 ATP synthase F0 subunit B [Paraliomyxa miuraensis]